MKPLGRKTNSLIRTARAAGLREKTTRKKRLTDRARTFRKSGLDVQKKYAASGSGGVFLLDISFHRTMLHAMWLGEITIRHGHVSIVGSQPHAAKSLKFQSQIFKIAVSRQKLAASAFIGTNPTDER